MVNITEQKYGTFKQLSTLKLFFLFWQARPPIFLEQYIFSCKLLPGGEVSGGPGTGIFYTKKKAL